MFLSCVFFVRISGHFSQHVSVAAAHFWLQFHVHAVVFFNVFGLLFDAPRCGIAMLFLDLPLRTG